MIDQRREKQSVRSRSSSRSSDRGSEVGEYEDEAYNNSDGNGHDKPIILNTKALYADFPSIKPDEIVDLTPDHYFLLPRRIDGYALGSKQKSILPKYEGS